MRETSVDLRGLAAMASRVNDRQRRSKDRAKHASCSHFTGYTKQTGAGVDSEMSKNVSRKMEESLVFMLGVRGTTRKSHSMGSRHLCETEIKGGAGDGKSGAGRKAGTLTKFTGPERVKCYPLPCTQVHSLPSCTTVRYHQQAPEAMAKGILC